MLVPSKYTLTLLMLISSSFLSRSQEVPGAVKPGYREAPQPKCDSYSMQNRVSLSALEKTCYYRDQLLSPSAISGAALFAGIAQATNSPREWPQGAKGFGWRVGTRYVQGMAKTTGGYLTGLALREDPRPARPDCRRPHDSRGMLLEAAAPRSFWGRVGGAVAVNFWTRDDSCKMRPAFAASAGALSSGFVGMAWTPDSSNTVTKALLRSGTALGGSIGSSIFTEFQGDITHVVTKLFGGGSRSNGGSPK
jgi:hypothetical protein